MAGRLILASLALLLASCGGVQAATCREAWDTIQAAITRNDPAAVQEAWRLGRPAEVCGNAKVFRQLANDAIDVHVRAARLIMSQGGPLSKAETLIEATRAFDGKSWLREAAAADIAHQKKNYALSAEHYQWALTFAREPDDAKQRPDAREEDRLYQRAVEARQLASSLVATPRVRGQMEGVYGSRVSVEPVGSEQVLPPAIPVPIQFGFNSDQIVLGTKDQAAADELCDYLKEKNPSRVKLIGHTDEVGSESYNNALSLRRAITVVEYLTNKTCGSVAYEVQGLGKSNPLTLSDPSIYPTQDERNRLNRRVELVLP